MGGRDSALGGGPNRVYSRNFQGWCKMGRPRGGPSPVAARRGPDTGAADTTSPADTGTTVDATQDTTTPDDTQSPDATPIDATEACPNVPLCNALAPECEAPLIPVVKGDCWGCGYPESCNCSDGGPDPSGALAATLSDPVALVVLLLFLYYK